MKCKICGKTIRVPAGEEPIKYIGKHYHKYHPEKFKRKITAAKKQVAAGSKYCSQCGKLL